MPPRTDTVWQTEPIASFYIEGVRGAIPLAQHQLDVMQRVIAACGIPVRRVLDLGCGDGILAAALLDRFPEAEAVLVDFSETMLAAARRRFAGRASPTRVVNADYGVAAWTGAVAALAPFDAIVSGYSIHHQPDARKIEIYREIFALLAPGGVFLNLEHVSSATPWVESLFDELFIDHLARHHGNKPHEEIARTYHERPDKTANILAGVEDQCAWLREIGYSDVDCYLKIFELTVFGGRRAR